MLTQKRIVKLTSLGFEYQTGQRFGFNQQAAEWLKYRAKHGLDPVGNMGALGFWVHKTQWKYTQLKAGKPTNLTQEQADKLTSWGFIWDIGLNRPDVVAEQNSWDEWYAKLIAYKELLGCILDIIVANHLVHIQDSSIPGGICDVKHSHTTNFVIVFSITKCKAKVPRSLQVQVQRMLVLEY
jgi:hypothetical protein